MKDLWFIVGFAVSIVAVLGTESYISKSKEKGRSFK